MQRSMLDKEVSFKMYSVLLQKGLNGIDEFLGKSSGREIADDAIMSRLNQSLAYLMSVFKTNNYKPEEIYPATFDFGTWRAAYLEVFREFKTPKFLIMYMTQWFNECDTADEIVAAAREIHKILQASKFKEFTSIAHKMASMQILKLVKESKKEQSQIVVTFLSEHRNSFLSSGFGMRETASLDIYKTILSGKEVEVKQKMRGAKTKYEQEMQQVLSAANYLFPVAQPNINKLL